MKNKKILGLILAGMMVANIIPQVSSANGAYQISRIFGKSRYNTSAEISRSVGYHSDKVILVSGENFADALTAGNLSDVGPILLTEKGKISQRVLNEMARNGAKEVIIVGGEGSVSKNVEKQLKGKKITRIAGRNRYETSTKLAKQLNTRNKGVVLANGDNFADALAAAPYAVQQSKKLVLTNGKELPKGINKEEVVEIIGGKKSVNIKGLENVNRISGKNRYKTAIEVAKKFGKITEIVIADGRNYPDALSSAPLAVKMKTGILLAEDSQVNALKNFLDQTYVTDVAVVGGKKSVSESLIKKLFSNAKVVNISDDTDIEIPKPAEKPDDKPDYKKPEDKPDKKPEEKPKEDSKELLDVDSPELSAKEKELIKLVNDYREQHGKKRLKVSKSLMKVARTHINDLNMNFDIHNRPVDARGMEGNLHSWSDKGNWTPVVYTKDHEYSKLMWNKPKEIAGYNQTGFEVAVGGVSTLTPQYALERWKQSPGHNDVILSQNGWDDPTPEQAKNGLTGLSNMGVAINGKYACIWFTDNNNGIVDPMGYFEFN
ncbi:MAG: cell wall-binding repeat-containing protein [Finegoldia magna]|nr:cell wall-binding repeat-containing protein [Finegoldia magna]